MKVTVTVAVLEQRWRK